jgi:ribonuclease HI
MQNINIHIDGRSFPNKGSGFAIILISQNNKWLRSFAYGKFSVNQADLLALKLALLSVKSNPDITVFTKNDYVINIFKKENNKYIQVPSSNKDLIDEIKEIIKTKNVTFDKTETELTELCKNMAISAIKEGKLVDVRK